MNDEEFKEELLKIGYKPPPKAGKGHTFGPIEDLSHKCTKCGQRFGIIDILMIDVIPPEIIDCTETE